MPSGHFSPAFGDGVRTFPEILVPVPTVVLPLAASIPHHVTRLDVLKEKEMQLGGGVQTSTEVGSPAGTKAVRVLST